MVDRRSFLQIFSAAVAGLASRSAAASIIDAATPTLYYMDGYHGGIRGHMPPGSWRDILNALAEFPRWKISLDIEPSSWEVLKRDDPPAFAELAQLLHDHSSAARVEMVAGTFAQPYGWAIRGESNIRQLQRGLEVIHEQFGEISVSTYAVQEPCWASCLPQILKSLRFDGAALRDASTAWGGYAAGKDAELVHWIGPDGTAIATVPRYAIEKLQSVYETESVDATAEFSRRCVEHGIQHPSGNCFQDLGWPAKPRVEGSYIRFTTWREYIHDVAQASEGWRFGIEDILVTLPWGDPTLRVVAQQVRSAELRLVFAEKLAALAHMTRRAEWSATKLQEAWDQLLLSQAHDAWITATTRKGRQAWSFEVASNTLQAQEIADEIAAVAAAAISTEETKDVDGPADPQWARVINTLAFEREDLAQLSLSTPPGTSGVAIRDRSGKEVLSQLVVDRRYLSKSVLADLGKVRSIAPGSSQASVETEGINHAMVLFRAKTPSLGYSTYQVIPQREYTRATAGERVTATTGHDGAVILESDLYRLRIDPHQGGGITSFFVKALDKDFCDASSQFIFNEYRGYFIAQQRWCSSKDTPASVSIVEQGPIRTSVLVNGQVGTASFQTRIELVLGQRRIDLHTRFSFHEDTWIGDPWEMKPEEKRSEPRRSQNDGRWKLQALFPTSFGGGSIDKNAAFDVCRSRNTDTFFQRWDDIKHNIIVDWVDLLAEDDSHGLAVFTDHTTAYNHGPEHPLGLVMGWAWEGGFWWGKSVLRGDHEISYALVPHADRWDKTQLCREYERFCESLTACVMAGQPSRERDTYSLLHASSPGLEASALLLHDERLVVRLFNAESPMSDHAITFSTRPAKVEQIALDGRVLQAIPVEGSAPDRHTVRVQIPRFGLFVLRCSF